MSESSRRFFSSTSLTITGTFSSPALLGRPPAPLSGYKLKTVNPFFNQQGLNDTVFPYGIGQFLNFFLVKDAPRLKRTGTYFIKRNLQQPLRLSGLSLRSCRESALPGPFPGLFSAPCQFLSLWIIQFASSRYVCAPGDVLS